MHFHSNCEYKQISQGYCSLLATATIFLRYKWNKILSIHLEVVLLTSLAICGFNNVWSVAENAPKTCESNAQFWIKVIALLFGAVLLPLLVPRQYVPVDPKNSLNTPNPEQTASLLSLIFFTYLDSIVWKASKLPHLSTEALPLLSDQDQARVLQEKMFVSLQHLDPLSGGGDQHVFFNILRVFSADIASMSVALICNATTAFIPAIATNRLLIYLETRESGNDMIPWFWILLLFVGPVLASSSMEWYMRVVLRTFVRVEALLTKLIFEHAIRARVRYDAGDDSQNNVEKSSASTVNINTLITVDLNTMEEGQHFLVLLTFVPVQIIICIVFLYKLLGWSAFVGLGLTVAMVPITQIATKSLQSVQKDKMKRTDSRVRAFTDVVNVLRMVKLFGWEEKMSERIAKKRVMELKASRKARLIELLLIIISFLLPFLTMFHKTDYFRSTLIAKGRFSASIAFPSLVVFESFRNQIQVAFIRGTGCVTAKVSLDRINNFLQNTELLDAFDSSNVMISTLEEESLDMIGFRNASFTWTKSASGTTTPSRRSFKLSVSGDLQFSPNVFNLVVGPTGSGKTSLLLALLGEMHYIPLNDDAWFNLSRGGGIAYAAQESWVLNETIKDNILFGCPYDEERYNKVIRQCALERDLNLLAAGDQTEVGEKGLTLSGGQKARLTLARAVYSKADILLLDDILAALDIHTSKWIVNECFSGDLVKDRTVIMVSHNIALLSPLVQRFIVMKDGNASISDNVDVYINSSNESTERSEEQVDSNAEQEKEVNSINGKLIVSEEVHKGTGVGWAAINFYISNLGGNHPFIFFTTFFTCLFASHSIGVIQIWYLGYWASQYDNHTSTEVPVFFYLGIYGLIFLIWLIIISSAHIEFILASVKASGRIHNQLLESVLAATFRWLDKTPVSRIITRSTQDIGSVDFALPIKASQVCDLSISLLFKIGAVVIFAPAFLLPSILLTALGIWVGNLYLKAQSSVKREMLIAKAPIVGLIGAASTGIISVRAYSAQDKFINLLMARIDHCSRSARVFYNLQRWMAIRTETLAGIFSAGLAWYLVYFTNSDASNTGFLLNLAGKDTSGRCSTYAKTLRMLLTVTFSGGMVWWVIAVNGLEAERVFSCSNDSILSAPHSLERLESYLQIDQEAHLGDGSIPPAHWPSSGELRVENLTAKYSSDGHEVLHQLSFHIKSGERIGVVGRTGSGKSTLILALLRCIFTTGRVYYDGILTSTLNLDALRSQITVIPQTPELISGTLRQNLDPFEEHEDYVLNDALRSAALVSLQEELQIQDRITLETPIASGGTNLSVGQRQIIALARAIIRQSKLLILDEATSAVDYKTDTIIQNSLRNEYRARGDATIITIAHRLQTVMDADRIMVLDAGRIVEFDSPQVLLRKTTGQFRAMVENANERLTLLAMVKE
ncbi:P-loop containing nucleoside triphosphate hydrolase protein [Lentinula aciculospora]|uniref:P-loop containing nucleoside triphosphate hydrolase protein n=1 Tax=Lentinula aciculospora TaxID=153920 RepID=A0A9W9AGH5_9AGAR|nr:P-loop containing nucleoside triphosphate hydrolase protein [Lentinula aciculospora]